MSSMAVALKLDDLHADELELLKSRRSECNDLLDDPQWLDAVQLTNDADHDDALNLARGIRFAVPLAMVLWLCIYFVIEFIRP